MASIRQLYVSLTLRAENYNNQIRQAQRETREFQKNIRPTTNLLNDLGSAARTAGIGLTASLTAPIAAVAGLGVQFNAMQEQAQIAFTTILGDGKKARDFLENMKDFAAKTPFEFEGLVSASQRLMAMGFEAERVVPLLTAVGDAAAALGGSADTINRVTLALGQMQGRGRVATQEMNQLTEVGIPAWKMLAEGMGVTEQELRKMVEKGLVPASEAVVILEKSMNSAFGGMMQKQATTFSGMLSTIKDEARFIAGDLTSGLFNVLKGPLQTAIEMLGRLKAIISGMSDEWKTVITVLAAVAAAIGPVLLALGAMLPAITAIIGAISTVIGWITAAGGLTAALGAVVGFLTGPVGVVAAITAAAAAIGYFLTTNETTGPALVEAWNLIYSGVSDVIAALGDIFNEALAAWRVLWAEYGDEVTWFAKEFSRLALTDIAGAIKTLAGLLKATLEVIAGTIKVFHAGLTGDWTKFCDGIKKIWDGLWTAIKAIMGAPMEYVKKQVEGFAASINKAFADVYDKVIGHSYVPDLIDGIKQEFGRLGQVMVNPAQAAARAVTQAFDTMFSATIGKFTQGIPIVGGLLSSLGSNLAKLGIGKLLGGTAAGSALGLGGSTAAGAGGAAAGGGAFGISGAALGAFFTNPITIGVGAAIGGVLLAKSLIGRGREQADKFVQGVENPFGRDLGSLLQQFHSQQSAGTLTLATATAFRDDAAALIRQYNSTAAEFAAQGKNQAKVVEQSMAGMNSNFGDNFSRVFDELNGAIAGLKASPAGSGIAETGRSLSASNIFSDAVDRFVAGLDKAPRGTSQGVTVNYTEGDMSVTIQGADKSPQEIAEELNRVYRTNRRGVLEELIRLIESGGESVATA